MRVQKLQRMANDIPFEEQKRVREILPIFSSVASEAQFIEEVNEVGPCHKLLALPRSSMDLSYTQGSAMGWSDGVQLRRCRRGLHGVQ